MSDFMLWLHANYIKPQIDSVPKQDYAFHLDIVRNNLRPAEQDSLDKALEFTAIQAFLPGLRTGEGLAYSRRVSRGSYL